MYFVQLTYPEEKYFMLLCCEFFRISVVLLWFPWNEYCFCERVPLSAQSALPRWLSSKVQNLVVNKINKIYWEIFFYIYFRIVFSISHQKCNFDFVFHVPFSEAVSLLWKPNLFLSKQKLQGRTDCSYQSLSDEIIKETWHLLFNSSTHWRSHFFMLYSKVRVLLHKFKLR